MLLVTGITGHSGGHFLRELVDQEYSGAVRCVVREGSDTTALLNSGLDVELIVGDLADEGCVQRAMRGVETVLHIASIRYSPTVVAAAIRENVKRVILVHTAGVFSKYKNASAEYISIERSLDAMRTPETGVVILRPTMIYGYLGDRNMSVFIRMVDRLRLFPVIDGGRNLLQPVHGRDLGRAYYQVLMRPETTCGAYVLSGERPISMREILDLISLSLGKSTVFVSIPLRFGVCLARGLRVLTLGSVDYIEKIQRMGEDRAFSHEEARLEFGYSPMPMAEGIRREVEDYIHSRSR